MGYLFFNSILFMNILVKCAFFSLDSMEACYFRLTRALHFVPKKNKIKLNKFFLVCSHIRFRTCTKPKQNKSKIRTYVGSSMCFTPVSAGACTILAPDLPHCLLLCCYFAVPSPFIGFWTIFAVDLHIRRVKLNHFSLFFHFFSFCC